MNQQNHFSKQIILAPLIFIVYLFTGCSSSDAYLQNMNVETNPIRHSIRITENRQKNDIILRPYFNFNSNKTLKTNNDQHTKVNDVGEYLIEKSVDQNYYTESGGINIYDFSGENLFWNIPNWQGGVDVDFAASNTFALTGGFNLSNINDRYLMDENVGIAFFKESESWAWRFDANLKYTEAANTYQFALVESKTITTGETRKVYLLNEKTKNSFWNFAFLYTVNSRRRDWPLNYFFNFGIGWQTFYDLNVDTKSWNLFGSYSNNDLSYNLNYLSFSTGIYKNILDSGRLVLGIRFTKYNDIDGRLFIPDMIVQYDFTLF